MSNDDKLSNLFQECISNILKAIDKPLQEALQEDKNKIKENCLKQDDKNHDNDVNYWKRSFGQMCKDCRKLRDKLAEAEKRSEEYEQKYNTEQEYAWKLRRQLVHVGEMYSNYYGTKSVLSKDIEKFLSDNLPPIWKRAKKNYEEKVEQKEEHEKETICGYWDWNEWWPQLEKGIKKIVKDMKRDPNELKNSGEL